MNLGEARLKSVNTSRPQLLHSDSKRSITASDDYYSLSDHASELSSGNEQPAILRYKTPPSQTQSPRASPDLLRRAGSPVQMSRPNIDANTRTIKFVEQETNTGEPLGGENMKQWRQSNTDISPPTPGVDDTPYIQFAIDQLTRDEELLGRRRDGPPGGDISPIEETVEPDFQNAHHEDPIQPVSPQEPDEPEILQPPRIHFPFMPRSTENVLVPAPRPEHDAYRYPVLNFIPGSLRLLPLLGLVAYCLFMIAGLMTSSIYSSKHSGLIPYDGLGTSLYFVFEFLPQILGAILLVWVLHIQATVQRILPFTLLASTKRPHNSDSLLDIPLFITNYLIPNLSAFRHGESLLGACSFIFWLCLWTVPLLSCVYQTRLYSVWMWDTVQPIAWVLIALYVLLIIALLLLAVHMRNRITGLKWDPVSLADIFVLIRRSTNLERLETRASQRIRPTSLGYFESPNRPGEVFYGIGEVHDDGSPVISEKGKGRAQEPTDLEAQQPTIDVHSANVRYRWTPWYMRDTWWILWLVLAFVLLIAFLVVSFVHNAVSFGFLPLLPAPTTSLGFSPANFLYSFLPCLLGMILFLIWQPFDVYFRALEPFAQLSAPRGATAEQSLLLSYTASPPVAVTVNAALAGHFKVAWISFTSLLSLVIPILAGGIFTAEFNVPAQSVREVATMPAYYALVVFLIVYVLSFLVLWPENTRYLPHDTRTIAEIVDFVYMSPMTSDPAFRDPRTKIDLQTRLCTVAPGEREIARYMFGVFTGRDGRERLGIERTHRPGFGAGNERV